MQQSPLNTSIAITATSDLFVGIDSCMLHVADLFRVPGVGLLGPTSPQNWGFRFGPHRHICATGQMSSIEESTVLQQIDDIITEIQ